MVKSEFTIRNPRSPLEGRLDLIKIRLADAVADSSKYIRTDDMVNLTLENIEIVQIKTGESKA